MKVRGTRLGGSVHTTSYGLATGSSSLKRGLADAVWTLAVGLGGLLLAVGLTYAAMNLGLGTTL